MALIIYQHPLASFCHKVLIGLYENGTPFELRLVDLAQEDSSAELRDLWPLGKFPVLRDERLDLTLPETSIILEYIDRTYPGVTRLLPEDFKRALQVRLWDRFFDLYVQALMQKMVGDHLRPFDKQDPHGVVEARAMLAVAYDMVERQLGANPWITGSDFTMADCSAAPALFFAETLVPFGSDRPALSAYYARLLDRPSYARVLNDARPFFKFYPYKERLPLEFRAEESL